MPSTGIGRPGSPALAQSSLPGVGSSFRCRPRIWPLRPMTKKLLNSFPVTASRSGWLTKLVTPKSELRRASRRIQLSGWSAIQLVPISGSKR